jgi:hypothetical protein
MKFYLSLNIFIEAYDTSYKFNTDSSTSAPLLKSKKIKMQTKERLINSTCTLYSKLDNVIHANRYSIIMPIMWWKNVFCKL